LGIGRRKYTPVSIDPDDAGSKHYTNNEKQLYLHEITPSNAAGLLLLAACNNNDTAKQSTAKATDTPDTVPVFVVHDTSVSKTIELPAELLPYEQAALFARVQGYVKE